MLERRREHATLIRLLISSASTFHPESTRSLPAPSWDALTVHGHPPRAITGYRNANSAAKGHEIKMRKTREMPRNREKRRVQSPDPNKHPSTRYMEFEGIRLLCFPRIGLLWRSESSQREQKRHRVCSRLGGGARLTGKTRTATEITRLRVFVASYWQKFPRRNALT